MFQNSADVVGYVHPDHYVICGDCSSARERRDLDAVFAGAEWDVAPTCDRCGETLNVVEIGGFFYESEESA